MDDERDPNVPIVDLAKYREDLKIQQIAETLGDTPEEIEKLKAIARAGLDYLLDWQKHKRQ